MASRGSVIPLFVNQIKTNQPITVTDPNMTRFMMSLDDAVNLVVYAFQHAQPGDIFVQKASACAIQDLTTALKEIFESKNEIHIIGTRHGEKLYETLLTREERVKAEDLGDYYRIVPDDRDLNYNKYFTEGVEQVSFMDDYNSHNTQRLTVDQVKEVLLKLDFIRNELKSKAAR
jgi:UDP-glucose 4-epimerase